MITERELAAMLSLLDDTDEEVVKSVEGHLLSLGTDAVTLLEKYWDSDADPRVQEKVERLVNIIQFDALKNELIAWKNTPDKDLFEGFYLITRYQYPNLNKQELDNKLNKIKLDAWLELKYDLTALEKVRILNHIFYDVNGFKGDTATYHSPQNSFINTVLERRKGNPISLAIIYSIIAQRLNIPIFGVNLPQHFILAYMDNYPDQPLEYHEEPPHLSPELFSDVMFYINPFNKGLVFSKYNVDEFLRQLRLEPLDSYFLPCSNVEIIKRVVRNLVTAYTQTNQRDKVEQLAQIMETLGGKIDLDAPENPSDLGDEE
ncbi:transglutaminase-like domain-containing protein [Oscillatoria amoena NRMC-F 0135]|nr:transglutaminase-like domain-containing protein [Oscillatoria amoena NRMC-F 0135]